MDASRSVNGNLKGTNPASQIIPEVNPGCWICYESPILFSARSTENRQTRACDLGVVVGSV